MAERTGCPVLLSLWSYVLVNTRIGIYEVELNWVRAYKPSMT